MIYLRSLVVVGVVVVGVVVEVEGRSHSQHSISKTVFS